MKISEAIIQNRNIEENTSENFHATYKGKEIIVSSNHGLGKPKFDHLTRFNIEVIDIKTGLRDVDSFEDCHNIRDAIICALRGACLIDYLSNI